MQRIKQATFFTAISRRAGIPAAIFFLAFHVNRANTGHAKYRTRAWQRSIGNNNVFFIGQVDYAGQYRNFPLYETQLIFPGIWKFESIDATVQQVMFLRATYCRLMHIDPGHDSPFRTINTLAPLNRGSFLFRQLFVTTLTAVSSFYTDETRSCD